MTDKTFFLVWNPATGYAKYKHDSKEEAEKEAKRLANNNPNSEFIVLGAVSKFTVQKVVKTEYEPEDEIPF